MKKFFVPISNAVLTAAALTAVSQAGYAQTIRVNGTACTLSPLQVLVTSTGIDITVPPACVGVTAPPPVIPPTPPVTPPTTPPVTPPVTPPGTPPSACGAGADCSVEGDVIPSPSRSNPGGNNASRAGKLNGPSPINAQMNSYAAENVSAKCSNATPGITRLWQHNINFGTYQSSGGNDYPFLAPNEAMTWKFTAPAEGANQVIQYTEGTQVFSASAYLTISDKPCDFDVSKAALLPGTPGSSCYKSATNGVELYYRSTTGSVASYECKMIPGQTYYLNLRMQDARPAFRGGSPNADSCAASGAGLCGGYVQIR